MGGVKLVLKGLLILSLDLLELKVGVEKEGKKLLFIEGLLSVREYVEVFYICFSI